MLSAPTFFGSVASLDFGVFRGSLNNRGSDSLPQLFNQGFLKETLINCPCGRIAALRGARNLNIFLYMLRFLRSVRLALHPTQTINQGFLNRKKLLFGRRGTEQTRAESADIFHAILVLTKQGFSSVDHT